MIDRQPPGDAALLTARTKRWVLLALSGLILLHACLWASTGLFSIDEAIYFLMAEHMVRQGSLTIWNGYEEIASPLLRMRFLPPGPNGLAPQYPSGYAFLAAPFFYLWEVRGLVLINALSAVATLYLTYALARTLYDDRALALNAALVLGLCTFFFEYSQNVWPHSLAMALVAAGALCAARAAALDRSGRQPARLALAALAGLIVALGATVRIDVILAAPPLFVWLLGRQADDRLPSLAFVAGLVPGLLAAVALNDYKFGVPSPLTYGQTAANLSLATYTPLIALFAAVVVAVWGLTLRRVRPILLGRWGAVGVALALITALAVPPLRALVLATVDGFYVLVINMQAYGAADADPGIVDDGGILVFYGALKKALLQSLPFLAVLILPVVHMVRGRHAPAHALCLLVIAATIVPFAMRQWHGGLSLNMRYFASALPFLAILAAYALAQLWRLGGRVSAPTARKAVIVGLIMGMVSFLAMGFGMAVGGIFQHYLPLAVAAVLAAGTIAILVRGTAVSPWLARGTTVVMLYALAYSGGVGAFYDTRVSQGSREARSVEGAAMAAVIRPDSLIIAGGPEHFARLNKQRVRLAIVHDHLPPDFGALTRFHIDHERPVYVFGEGLRDAVVADLADEHYQARSMNVADLPLFQIVADPADETLVIGARDAR